MSTQRMPIAAPAARWNAARLLDAPHRLAFAAGALLLAASALWWLVAMLAQLEGQVLPWALPPATAHGLVMGFGCMPMFFAGFLFTAGPKWLAVPAPPARALLAPLLAQLSGWLVFLLAAHGRDAEFGRTLGAIGLAAVAVGWTQLLWRFAALLRRSEQQDRVHATLVAAAGAIGAALLIGAAGAVAAGELLLVGALTQAGLWVFVGLVFVAVSHRMIPFFSAAAVPALDAWRPQWLLWSLVAVLAVEAGAAAAGAMLVLPAPVLWALAAFEAAAGAALLALALRWGLVQSLSIRLLAMLHLGFVWLGLALLLGSLSHGLQAASEGALSLGLAPLHAYTMGFLGSTLFAMVTRVSCGHGGRALTADDFIWRFFWVLQLAVVVRVAAGVAAPLGPGLAWPLLASAAVGWAGVCAAWALRYGRWYGLPRADGRPG